MTSIPVKLTERRAELLRESEEHHASMLALVREMRVTDARLSELLLRAGEPEVTMTDGRALFRDSVFPRYPDPQLAGGLAPNAEVGAQASASGVSSVAPGAESAPAGIYGGQSLGAAADERLDSRTPALGNVSESPSTNPPPEGGEGVVAKNRAPKRDIRGMVMEYVDRRPQPPTLVELAAGVDMPVSRIEMVVASLQRDQRVILIGGVVKRTKGADGLSGHRDDAPHPWYGPCDALGPAGACVECGKALTAFSGPMMRDALITFLTREPDSTMAEINAAGISAAEVYRAEREGVIILKAHGLYALPEAEGEKESAEAKQSEAAE